VLFALRNVTGAAALDFTIFTSCLHHNRENCVRGKLNFLSSGDACDSEAVDAAIAVAVAE
jgi:hypothetical protein